MEYNTLAPWQEMSENGIVYSFGSLYDRFQGISDPRKAKGKQYDLLNLLVVIFLAKLSGKDNPVEIADWAKNEVQELGQLLRLNWAQMPHHNTYRRVFQQIVSEEEFAGMMEEYHQQQNEGDGEVLAMDGKALRGTRKGGESDCNYVLSVYDGQTQRVKVQEGIETKANEIVAAPKALERVSLAGKVVTGDAIHTQRGLSAQILKGQGQYVWPVKNNQERLHDDIERLFAPDRPKPGFGQIETDFQSAKQVSYGHGRIEIRTLQTSQMLNGYSDWPGLAQVYRLERKFFWLRQDQVYKTTCQVEFGITSLSRQQASPAKVLQLRRQHWLIETGLHYRRDVTFHEDATRMTLGHAAHILAIVHNLVLGLIKKAGFSNAAKARRYYEGHLSEAFLLLTSPYSLS